MHPVHICRHIKLCPKQSWQTVHCLAIHLYYYSSPVRKNLSSKFDENLPGPSAPNSTAIIAYIFLLLHLANPLPLCDRFLRLSFVFYNNKIMKKTTNAMKAYRSEYSIKYAARTMIPTLYCRLVARWRHWFLL